MNPADEVRPFDKPNGVLDKTNGLVVMLILLFGLVTTLGIFRPHRPSPFTAHGAFGAGFGSESIMVGASSRLGGAK
jgi:hypothetical protein